MLTSNHLLVIHPQKPLIARGARAEAMPVEKWGKVTEGLYFVKNARLVLGVCLSVGLSIIHWCIRPACYTGQGFELGRIYFHKKIPSDIVSVWP